MFYTESKKNYIEEELAQIISERPQLTHRERRVMRDYLAKEFESVWEQRDEVYGEQSGSEAGAKN